MSETTPISQSLRDSGVLAASAGQTEFEAGFPAQRADDIVVARVNDDGSETPYALNTDYTVTSLYPALGCKVVFNAPFAGGEKIRVRGVSVLERETSVTRNGKYRSAAVEEDLDRLMMIAQEHRRAMGGADGMVSSPLLMAPGEASAPLPPAAQRGGRVLSFDDAGQPVAGLRVEEGVLQGFVWRGDWAAGQDYDRLDLAKVGDTTYVAKAAHTSTPANQPPSDVWDEFVSGGGDVRGPDGASDGHLAAFSGTDGKTVRDSGVPASMVTGSLDAMPDITVAPDADDRPGIYVCRDYAVIAAAGGLPCKTMGRNLRPGFLQYGAAYHATPLGDHWDLVPVSPLQPWPRQMARRVHASRITISDSASSNTAAIAAGLAPDFGPFIKHYADDDSFDHQTDVAIPYTKLHRESGLIFTANLHFRFELQNVVDYAHFRMYCKASVNDPTQYYGVTQCYDRRHFNAGGREILTFVIPLRLEIHDVPTEEVNVNLRFYLAHWGGELDVVSFNHDKLIYQFEEIMP